LTFALAGYICGFRAGGIWVNLGVDNAMSKSTIKL
jgi:hypothetical protein